MRRMFSHKHFTLTCPNMDKASRILRSVLIDYFYPTISNPKSSKLRSSKKNFTPQTVKSTPFLTFSLHIHAYSLHSQFFHSTHTKFHSTTNFSAPFKHNFASLLLFLLYSRATITIL